MVFDFEPWKLDIDIDSTKELYRNNECNRNINLTNKVMQLLSEEQRYFFKSLSIDISKVDIKENIYDFSEENPPEKTLSIRIRFMMCGRFFAIPEFQNDLYWKEKIFIERYPTDLTVVNVSDYFTFYDVDNMSVIFKHPYTSMQNEKFKKWECGYVLGDAIIKVEL
ncbi:MAG: hypothetical protein H2212_12775 [Ruminococcus sp.]|nr:hypothetical protein [Ruminococcus sp.]